MAHATEPRIVKWSSYAFAMEGEYFRRGAERMSEAPASFRAGGSYNSGHPEWHYCLNFQTIKSRRDSWEMWWCISNFCDDVVVEGIEVRAYIRPLVFWEGPFVVQYSLVLCHIYSNCTSITCTNFLHNHVLGQDPWEKSSWNREDTDYQARTTAQSSPSLTQCEPTIALGILHILTALDSSYPRSRRKCIPWTGRRSFGQLEARLSNM